MAEKKCKFCAMQIPSDAKLCPYCRKKLTHLPWWVSILVIVVVLYSCGKMASNTTTTTPEDNKKYQVQADCENFVKSRLKSPSTAKFPVTSQISIQGSGEGPWTVNGYVDATNSFNASIRTNYKCVLHYKGDKVVLDKLETFE